MGEWIFSHLPDEILRIIWSFVSPLKKMLCSKVLYLEYHPLFISLFTGPQYHRYIRHMVRNNSSFIVRTLMLEERGKWGQIKMYKYGGFVYDRYETFLRRLCKEYRSHKVLEVLNECSEISSTKGGGRKAYRRKRTLKGSHRWTNWN